MIRTRTVFALVAAWLSMAGWVVAQDAPGSAAALERRLVPLADHVRARTVLVFGVIGSGSGAVVDVRGTVVTNAHVAAGARYATVQWSDGRTALVRRLGIDYARDLAILEPVEPLGRPTPAFSLAARAPAVGSWVAAGGFPGGLRATPAPTFSVGRVLPSDVASGQVGPGGFLDYAAAIRSDAPIFSGNSGGPLVDLAGRLVGINGAVDLGQGVSLSIPVDVATERLATLTDGRILLPDGRSLDPEANPVLRAFYRATDAIARSLGERVAQASREAAVAGGGRPQPLTPPDPAALAPVERLASVARRHPRQEHLAAACSHPRVAGVATAAGIPVTPIDHLHAVTVASRLGGRTEVTVEGRPGHVVAVSAEDDLALIRLPEPIRPLPQDAPLRPVGSVVYLRGASGLVAAGVVSAAARPASAALLARIQRGAPPQVERALRLAEQASERLGIEAVQAVVQQIRRSLEARRAFAGGTPPRSRPEVVSVDAPVPPSALGSPVLDRDGRLIGPAVGVAHFGTTYVVPIARVRRVFARHLPARAPVPEQVGAARLY